MIEKANALIEPSLRKSNVQFTDSIVHQIELIRDNIIYHTQR